MKITIIGLGLMGGSLTKALRGFRSCTLTGFDVSPSADIHGAVDKLADSAQEAVSDADLTVFCVPPETAAGYFKTLSGLFKSGSVVTEICGVKGHISAIAEEVLPSGVRYAGIHPMAGKEVSGFEASDAKIFQKTGFIITSPEPQDDEVIALLRDLAVYIGAAHIEVSSTVHHDAMIAYTSDLMHLSAYALCLDKPEGFNLAYTAGAFRDCTRIARSDPSLWTALFRENKHELIPVLERYINSLNTIKTALEDDGDSLRELLTLANENKWEMGSL